MNHYVCRSLDDSQQSVRAGAQVFHKEVILSHFTPYAMPVVKWLAGREEGHVPNDLTDFHLEALKCCHTYWKI